LLELRWFTVAGSGLLELKVIFGGKGGTVEGFRGDLGAKEVN